MVLVIDIELVGEMRMRQKLLETVKRDSLQNRWGNYFWASSRKPIIRHVRILRELWMKEFG